MVTAQFGGNRLTFNVDKLDGFFDNPINASQLDLVIHELGHSGGMHTEMEYHGTITKMAGELVMIALKEPEWFDIR